MQRATTDILYTETGPDNAPTMFVEPGEEFEIQTQINPGPWLDGHPDEERLRKKLGTGNPSSGAIHVKGAKPGQCLVVHIGAIDVDPLGWTRTRGNAAAMPAWLGGTGIGAHDKIVEIKDGMIAWSDTIRLTAEPMLGFVGVAPDRTRWGNGWAERWGGNFDIQEITTGASVYLPISVHGALLQVGDMHARQGDGEVGGAGIEAGGVVRITCDVIDMPKNMEWPRIIDATHIMSTAQARPLEDAFRTALAEMVLWLEADYGFSRGDAYLFLGQVLEARCTQDVDPTYTYICKVRKDWLPGA